jgi:CDP-glycerol glycerophosphotransferase (TagB/SpsB family)/glycosyltransferase involved in cell wall biosynthesis
VTRFSVILPVYNVRAYLRECLDSILSQSFRDFEIIAVDDRSPDGSGEILDEYAQMDARVRVLHLAKNVGLGLAREAGMAEATGDYLLFVDSDDLVTPGSFAALSERIDATDRPDIVLFDYARLYWWRETVRNQLAHLLTAPGPEVFGIRERRDLLNLLMVVWNKAYRRDYVRANGFAFPKGYYEDTSWTYPSMLAAERIAILPRVCVLYRQRRQGNILRSRSRKHFDIFDQWDHVFAFLEGRPDLADWRPFLMRRELEHVVTILDSPRRLPAKARREFFDRAHAHYEQHRQGHPVEHGRGLEGAAVATVMRHSYAGYRLVARLRRLPALRVRITEALRWRLAKLARKSRTAMFRAYYRVQARLPVEDNVAVFAAYWYRGIQCNPAAIYWKMRELVPDVKGVWVLKDPETVPIPDGVEYVRPSSFAYFRLIARAKFFVNNANFPDIVRKRPGAVHLQTQHGTPLKKMGLDLQEFPVGANRMNFTRLLARIDRWDFNLSGNQFSTIVWERSYPAGFETLEVGYPRNDQLVHATPDDQRRIREKLGISGPGPVVLYAPTFRDYQKTFSPELDLRALVDAIGPDGVLLMRAHYFNDGAESDPLGGAGADTRILDVSDHPSTEELCIASDALLTDYSSIMFDYALLDRPMAVYAYDWDTYVRTRGVNFDLTREPPGVLARTEDELLDAFRTGEVWGDEAAKARAQFRAKFCEFDDGNAAERVVRRVFLGEKLPARMESASTGITEGSDDPDSTERGGHDHDAQPPEDTGSTDAEQQP